MKPSKETVKKLRKLQTFIRKEPRRFDMSWWGTTVKEPAKIFKNTNIVRIDQNGDTDYDLSVDKFVAQKPPCGTMACLAGSALMMAGLVKPKFSKVGADAVAVYDFGWDTPTRALKYLGLGVEYETSLFHVEGWPKKFTPENYWELSPKKQVELACKRIDHFIETGE